MHETLHLALQSIRRQFPTRYDMCYAYHMHYIHDTRLIQLAAGDKSARIVMWNNVPMVVPLHHPLCNLYKDEFHAQALLDRVCKMSVRQGCYRSILHHDERDLALFDVVLSMDVTLLCYLPWSLFDEKHRKGLLSILRHHARHIQRLKSMDIWHPMFRYWPSFEGRRDNPLLQYLRHQYVQVPECMDVYLSHLEMNTTGCIITDKFVYNGLLTLQFAMMLDASWIYTGMYTDRTYCDVRFVLNTT